VNKRKALFRLLRIALLLIGAVIIYNVLSYFLVDDTESYTRVTLHDFYEMKEIDDLFVGPSHSVQCINAEKLTADTGREVFNLSTIAQDFMGGFYLIKEANESKQFDRLFYEVSISKLDQKTAGETAVYIITDYLRNPVNKYSYLYHAMKPEKYIIAVSPLRRGIDPVKLPDFNKINTIRHSKATEEYKKYLGNEDYAGRGQWIQPDVDENDSMEAVFLRSKDLDSFGVEDITDLQWGYFVKILDYCAEKNINLTLYLPPYSEYYLKNFTDYEQLTARVKATAKEYGVDLIDLNLVKDEYLNLESSDFFNGDHMHYPATIELADFLEIAMNDPNGDYYYESLAEKYPKDSEVISVGYDRTFIAENGEYDAWTKEGGEILSLRLTVSAVGYEAIPAEARIWTVEQDEQGSWVETEEFTGEKKDDYNTEFIVPYKDFEPTYKVQLIDPDTREVIYETYTQFSMT